MLLYYTYGRKDDRHMMGFDVLIYMITSTDGMNIRCHWRVII